MSETTSSRPQERQSNLELFRILVMLAIVYHHYVVNSGVLSLAMEHRESFRSLYYILLGAWGKTGINCFVCITAWFMCKRDITAKKFLKLVMEIYFYKIIFFVIFYFAGYETLTRGRILGLLSPIGTSLDKNFVGCFLVFFLCIPFLNILISNLSRKQHLRLAVLLLVGYTILPTCPDFYVTFNYVTWFCVLFVAVAYLRLYPNRFSDSLQLNGLITGGGIVIACLSIFVITRWHLNISEYWLVADSNKILAVLIGISSFLFFKNIPLPSSRLINTIASTTFGVLLIHANSNAMRQFLWRDFLHNADFFSSAHWMLHSLCVPLAVFSVCSCIEFLRMNFMEPSSVKLAQKLLDLK